MIKKKEHKQPNQAYFLVGVVITVAITICSFFNWSFAAQNMIKKVLSQLFNTIKKLVATGAFNATRVFDFRLEVMLV